MPLFARFARWVERQVGRSSTFLLAIAVVVLWAASGPIFGWSDTWQLVINTATTIVTFLMVFVIQNTQTRDTQAMQLKLDELIRVNEMARGPWLSPRLRSAIASSKPHRSRRRRAARSDPCGSRGKRRSVFRCRARMLALDLPCERSVPRKIADAAETRLFALAASLVPSERQLVCERTSTSKNAGCAPESQFAPDSPLEEGVTSEPVSCLAQFPASWENTGNYARLGPL